MIDPTPSHPHSTPPLASHPLSITASSFPPSLHHTLLISTVTPSHPPHSRPHSITPSLPHILIIPTVTSTLPSCSLLSTPSLICFNSFFLLIHTDQPPRFYLPLPTCPHTPSPYIHKPSLTLILPLLHSPHTLPCTRPTLTLTHSHLPPHPHTHSHTPTLSPSRFHTGGHRF